MKLKTLVIGIFIVLSGTGLLPAQQTWKSVDVQKREMEMKYRLAQQYEQQGQIDRALVIYRELVNQDPGQVNYYLRYSSHLFRLKQYAELERIIEQFLKYNPGNDQAIIDQGKLFFSRGDTAQAIQHWENNWKAKNYSNSFTLTLFNSLISLHRYDLAENIIRTARKYHHKEDLFAIELANFAWQRGQYIQSASEYLLYGRQNYRNYPYISSQILRFPNDSSLFADIDSMVLLELKTQRESRDLHKLRSDWHFRFGSYQEALNEVFIIEELDNYKGNAILEFAHDLLVIGKFRMTEEIYTKIIETPQFRAITPKALLGLADAFEKEMLAGGELSPFDYFYRDNFFFIPDYIFGINAEDHFIRQAFSIYDSVIVSLPKSTYTAEALYRLGELRYRVLQDIDGAAKLYSDAMETGATAKIRDRCIIRLTDLMIARGELNRAIDYAENFMNKSEGSAIEKELAVRRLLALFYLGEIDSVLVQGKSLMGMLGITDPYFNDVVEFSNFIEAFAGSKSGEDIAAFRDFIKGELLIRQNKLSEAREVLSFLLKNYPDQEIAAAAKFRLLQLELFFREKELAESTLNSILDHQNPLADDALFMMAELAQIRDNDPEYAAKWYEIILEQYPDSFLTDDIRKRLRAIRSSTLKLQEL